MKVLLVSADRTGGSGAAINLGDAFLSDRLAEAIESTGHTVRVTDFGAPRRGGPRPRLRLGGVLGLARAVQSTDAVVVGGGTLLQDDSSRPWGGLPRLVAVTSLLCRLLRRPCVFFGVGCDPVKRRLPGLLIRAAVKRRPVWVRDEASADRLQAMTSRRPEVAADVCLLGPRATARTGGRGVVLALADKDAAALSATSVQALRERFGAVTFVQMSQGDGAFQDGSQLSTDTRAELDLVTTGLNWSGALEHYAASQLVIASRMHALYMGMLTGRPLLAVATSPKVRSFCEEFGVTGVVSPDQAVAQALSDQGAAQAEGSALTLAASRVGGYASDMVGLLRYTSRRATTTG